NDTRACPAPSCGGYWVTRANKSTTKCADGSYASSCYAADLDLSRLALSSAEETKLLNSIGNDGDETGVVIRASLTKTTIASHPDLGLLKATEAWRAPSAGTVSVGSTFYKVTDSGIRCITTPCASEKAAKLNISSSKNITDLDLSGAPGS